MVRLTFEPAICGYTLRVTSKTKQKLFLFIVVTCVGDCYCYRHGISQNIL
jgi:hypothetical protein